MFVHMALLSSQLATQCGAAMNDMGSGLVCDTIAVTKVGRARGISWRKKMGTMQDKLRRGVVYAGCVRFR